MFSIRPTTFEYSQGQYDVDDIICGSYVIICTCSVWQLDWKILDTSTQNTFNLINCEDFQRVLTEILFVNEQELLQKWQKAKEKEKLPRTLQIQRVK